MVHAGATSLGEGEPAFICVLGLHAIPISTAVRAAGDRVLFALGQERETLRRLRRDSRAALCLLGEGVAFTAFGEVRIVGELESADTVVAVELRVERVQNHLADLPLRCSTAPAGVGSTSERRRSSRRSWPSSNDRAAGRARVAPRPALAHASPTLSRLPRQTVTTRAGRDLRRRSSASRDPLTTKIAEHGVERAQTGKPVAVSRPRPSHPQLRWLEWEGGAVNVISCRRRPGHLRGRARRG